MQNKINLSELFKNDKAFENKFKKIQKEINKYKEYEGILFSSPEKLYEFLEFDSNISKEEECLYLYAHINSDLDLANSHYQEYYGMVMNMFNKVNELTSFVLPEILSHSYEEFLDMLKKYPQLKEYKINVKKIFRNKKIVKSKEEEAIISLLTSTYHKVEETSSLLSDTDLSYGLIHDENNKEVELTNSNYTRYIESPNRNVRKETFDKLYAEYKAHENTYGSIFSTEVMNNNHIAKLRKFSSARSLALYSNDINNNVYDKLLIGVNKNISKFYPYYELKQKILGLEDFHLYDTYANIVKDYNKKYTYNEAKDIIISSLSVLGKKYVNDLSLAFKNSWIDYGICKTKRSGAYCTCAYKTHPYVVCSYDSKYNDVLTLAHELGHAMHYYYAQKNQTYQDYSYSIFVAEVASQVNEILLTDYLIKKSNDKEEKKYFLDMILQRFKSTIIRQTMFAEFEDTIHNMENKGLVLTKDIITNTYYDINKKYFGPNVILDEAIKYEVFRIPHFYYNFYVYQYSTGYAAAIKIANSILSNEENSLDNYLKFLKLGSTKDPVASLKIAGVDMTNPAIYDEVFTVFEKRLKELRSLYE